MYQSQRVSTSTSKYLISYCQIYIACFTTTTFKKCHFHQLQTRDVKTNITCGASNKRPQFIFLFVYLVDLGKLTVSICQAILHTTQNFQNIWIKISGLETNKFGLKIMMKSCVDFFEVLIMSVSHESQNLSNFPLFPHFTNF